MFKEAVYMFLLFMIRKVQGEEPTWSPVNVPLSPMANVSIKLTFILGTAELPVSITGAWEASVLRVLLIMNTST